MNVFAAAMDRIYANPSMAAAAVWISSTTSEERPIHVIRRAQDRITDFGAGRFVSDTTVVDDRLERIETDIRAMRDVMFEAFQRGRAD